MSFFLQGLWDVDRFSTVFLNRFKAFSHELLPGITFVAFLIIWDLEQLQVQYLNGTPLKNSHETQANEWFVDIFSFSCWVLFSGSKAVHFRGRKPPATVKCCMTWPIGSMGLIYLPYMDPIHLSHSWIGKYTIVPWIRHGWWDFQLDFVCARLLRKRRCMVRMFYRSKTHWPIRRGWSKRLSRRNDHISGCITMYHRRFTRYWIYGYM